MRRVAAALVLVCLVAVVWLGRATRMPPRPEPTVAAPPPLPPPPPSPSPVRAPAPAPTRRAPRVLRSEAPALVRGCVVRENGEPAVGAYVHVEADGAIPTDEDGCFRAEVPPGDYALWASVDRSGGLELWVTTSSRSSSDACAAATPRDARRPRRSSAGALQLDEAPPDEDETFTDEDGRVWPMLEASEWTPLTLAPGEEVDGVELVLQKAHALAGQASRDATICVAPPGVPGVENCQRSEGGAFNLGPLPGGPLRLVARDKDGDEILLVAELPGPRGGLHLQLPPGADADGDDADEVDDALAEVPLRSLDVRVADEHDTLLPAAVTVRARGYWAAFDTSGLSTVSIPRDRHCVSVCATAEARLEACAAIRDELHVALVLPEPTALHGFVRLPGGAPAAGAYVRCGGAGYQGGAQADARGQFELSCARTTSALEVSHDGDVVAVPVVFAGEDDYLEIRL